ncbi:MAG TPA: site-2 protease family protein [Pyrinomonadaceae bacterium]|nr:site-2 protease family protein [Pyrinomonadaceae bacterium]
MPDTSIIGHLIIYIVVLLLAISAHEAAHAWMSYKFGDDTAYLLGRVTLNPVAHTDPIGTLLIPVINFIGASSGVFIPLIGWGKPTPVNPLSWRNKDLANVMVSLAGIMANLLIAIIAFIIFKVLLMTGTLEYGGSLASVGEPVTLLLVQVLFMNITLAVFNLLPIPPLDGSKVLETILPASAQPILETMEQFSFILLIAIIYFGVVSAIVAPIRRLVIWLLLPGAGAV